MTATRLSTNERKACRGSARHGTVQVMEAREDRDPGYDDWFDEPEPLTETQSGANRGVYEDVEEVWVLPEEEGRHGGGRREIFVGGRTLTMTQVAIIAISVLAVFFGILAAFGVFNGGKTATPPVTPPAKKVTTPAKTSTTPADTTPTAEAPAQTLKPGDTGSQVKVLQRALTSLGFSPGTPDGDYGTSTQNAVERFQTSKGLTPDGIVGSVTLNALQRALTSSTGSTSTTTVSTAAPNQTLKPGDTGSQVKVLQRALAALGFSPGTPDGGYGTSTQSAVAQFQAAKGIPQDGIVGPQTLNALQKALAGG